MKGERARKRAASGAHRENGETAVGRCRRHPGPAGLDSGGKVRDSRRQHPAGRRRLRPRGGRGTEHALRVDQVSVPSPSASPTMNRSAIISVASMSSGSSNASVAAVALAPGSVATLTPPWMVLSSAG